MFVHRNEHGKINGVFTSLQPGVAEEFLNCEDPELIEFFEGLGSQNVG